MLKGKWGWMDGKGATATRKVFTEKTKTKYTFCKLYLNYHFHLKSYIKTLLFRNKESLQGSPSSGRMKFLIIIKRGNHIKLF